MRKTKIICTMGPSVKSIETIKDLLISGMNIARFNFSHGDHQYHKEMFDIVKESGRQTSIPVALLLDTKGPEIRTGLVKDNIPIHLKTGSMVTITTVDMMCDEKIISISYKKLPHEILPGNHIYIADGLVDLEVQKINGNEIICLVKNDAVFGSNKNVNIVGIKTSLPTITEQDVKDIIFGIENNIDFISASFIRKPSDVKEIRGLIDICDSKVDIIAKIEDREGLDNIDEIIRVSNGIMVARGDLGVQIRPEEIPLVQKRIINKCNIANKPVITATQMLESMIINPAPTRAEVTDIANAILDGTDAIMLSGETASGKYPVQAVQVMHKIAVEIENSAEYKDKARIDCDVKTKSSMADTICRAAFITAKGIGAQAIFAPTLHGNTPRFLSKYRPDQIIIAATPYHDILRKLLLYWGVYPVISELTENTDTMIDNTIRASMNLKLIKPFDKVVLVAGIPVNSPIMLNTIRIHLVSNVLGKSLRGYGKIVSGRIVKVNDLADAVNKIKGTGDEILLTKYIDENFKPIFKKIKGYILEEFSFINWDEIALVNPELVGLAGTLNATKIFSEGQVVTLDGEEKLIYEGEMKSSNIGKTE